MVSGKFVGREKRKMERKRGVKLRKKKKKKKGMKGKERQKE